MHNKLWRKVAVGILAALAFLIPVSRANASGWAHLGGGRWGAPLINDTLTAACALNVPTNPAGARFTAESTTVLNTSGFRAVALVLHVTPVAGDTTSTVRLAIATKVILSDSLSIPDSLAAEIAPAQLVAVNATVPFDSAAVTLATVGIGAANPGNGVSATEKLYNIDPWRGRAGKAAVEFSIGTYYIPLTNFDIIEHEVPGRLQVRIRLLGYNCADATKKPRVMAWVIGIRD